MTGLIPGSINSVNNNNEGVLAGKKKTLTKMSLLKMQHLLWCRKQKTVTDPHIWLSCYGRSMQLMCGRWPEMTDRTVYNRLSYCSSDQFSGWQELQNAKTEAKKSLESSPHSQNFIHLKGVGEALLWEKIFIWRSCFGCNNPFFGHRFMGERWVKGTVWGLLAFSPEGFWTQQPFVRMSALPTFFFFLVNRSVFYFF